MDLGEYHRKHERNAAVMACLIWMGMVMIIGLTLWLVL